MSDMRQLITRIDDGLHERLKRRAAADGRSVNEFVNNVLMRELDSDDPRALFRARAEALGRIVYPPMPKRVPSRAAVERATRGAGQSVSKALAAERASR